MGKTWTRALVTGASSGIGEAFARRLAILGTDLVLVARDEARLVQLADELDDFHGVSCEVLVADLSDRDQLARVEQRLGAALDPIDLLVNNAGYGFHRPFLDIPVDDEDAEIQVNVVAVMRLAHALASRVRDEVSSGATHEGSRAGIINVASTAAFQPQMQLANYSATKAYVASLSQALHDELRPLGIVVTCVCPGLTRTRFQERAGVTANVPDVVWQTPEEVAAKGLTAVGQGRVLVVSGLINKALQVTTRLAPMSVVRWGSSQVLTRVK